MSCSAVVLDGTGVLLSWLDRTSALCGMVLHRTNALCAAVLEGSAVVLQCTLSKVR